MSRDQAGKLKAELERVPLRFAFQDGQVAGLCPDPRDQPWTLNVKRGVLSALQNSMASLDADQSVQEVGVFSVPASSQTLASGRDSSPVCLTLSSLRDSSLVCICLTFASLRDSTPV